MLKARRQIFQPDFTTSSKTLKQLETTLLPGRRPKASEQGMTREARSLARKEQRALDEAAEEARKAVSGRRCLPCAA